MLSKLAVRQLYESLGPHAFARKWRELLGIKTDRLGRTVIQDQQLSPSEVSIRALAESICGESWVESLGRPGIQGHVAELYESNPAVVPSSFANISAFSLVMAGTLEARILEGFNQPQMIADGLLTTKPTNLRINRTVAVGRVPNLFEEISPGEEHPAINLNEEYVDAPPTKKIGGRIDVTREAVFFDLTGQLLDEAQRLGELLRLNHEIRALKVVAGVDNTYKYNGSAFYTYYDGSAPNHPWTNSLDVPLTSWLSLNRARAVLSKAVDPTTGIMVGADAVADTLLVTPASAFSAQAIVGATSVRANTDGIATSTEFPNPLANSGVRVFSSAILYQILTTPAPEGLGLSPQVADNVWFFGNSRKAFAWFENWGIVTRSSSTDSSYLNNRDLVLQLVANEMGVASVQRPQYFVRSIPQAGYLTPGGAPVLVPTAPIPTIDLTPSPPPPPPSEG